MKVVSGSKRKSCCMIVEHFVFPLATICTLGWHPEKCMHGVGLSNWFCLSVHLWETMQCMGLNDCQMRQSH